MTNNSFKLEIQDSFLNLLLDISFEILADCLNHCTRLLVIPHVYVGHMVTETSLTLDIYLDTLRNVHYTIFDHVVDDTVPILFKLGDREKIHNTIAV